MKRESLRFHALEIRRAPGFESLGFTLAGLSPGINLIHGPNGAGKSTTARVVSWLLWPRLRDAEGISVHGRFGLAGAEWFVDIDGSRVCYQRDGVAASAPALPPGEEHQRYLLSLHDLLQARDEGFAAAIARESAGGYDLRRSGEVLQPRAPVSRRNALNEALDRARDEYDHAVARQQALREDEGGLVALRERFQAAERAQHRMAVLQAGLEHARAREAEADARAMLTRFDRGMERVAGDEYERLCRLRDRVRTIDEQRRESEAQVQEARTREAILALPQEALPQEALREELLRGLQVDLEALQSAEQDVGRARAALGKARSRREAEEARLGSAVDAERLAEVELAAVSEVAAFARSAQALTARRAALEAQLGLLTAEPPVEGSVRLEQGIRLLRCWLREPAPIAPRGGRASRAERLRHLAGIAASVLLAVLGIALAVTGRPLYLVIAAVGAVLLWAALRPGKQSVAGVDARDVHRREYEKLGLGLPPTWEPGEVEVLLENLQERADGAREAEARLPRRRELQKELEELAELERELETERSRIAERLGVPARTGLTELVWMVEAVGRWQSAHGEEQAEDRALRVAQEDVEAAATGLRSRLAPYGYSSLATTGAIAGAIAAFGERRRALQAEREKLRSASAVLRRLQEEREAQQAEIQRLFATLQLDAGSDEIVREWCETRAEYRRYDEAHRKAETILAAARAKLQERGAEEGLATCPLHEIEACLAAERTRGARRDELARAITVTETRIAEAKRSHGVEEALERVQRAEEALRQARERDVRGAVAFELIGALERATRDQHLPAVFVRARELFTRITQGRYELRLEREGETPQFTAFDRVDRRGRGLEALSSGTRVQLLLAVRVAFVEQQEHGVMLPLLLDEVLGNSDEERASAVMQAAVELAREGRQIFYFTAQLDEVARWRALLSRSAASVHLRVVDLRSVQQRERRLEVPIAIPPARPAPRSPEGSDHAEYGRRLGVPRLDRAEADAAAVHLWYLVEDPGVLHRLLSLGPDRWGPLRALVRDGGRPLVDERMIAELEACGRVAEAFLEASRVGVGRRVDRTVLEQSGVVTRAFIDRVADLAQSLGGDGVRLMASLEAAEVPRFTQKSKERLRAFLDAGGYLPQEPPLELVEIRMRVLSRVAVEVGNGTLSLERMDRLIGRMWTGVGGISAPVVG